MKNLLQKQNLHITLLSIGVLFFVLVPMSVYAEVVPLAPLPTNFGDNTDTLGGYINTIFYTIIAAAAVLAVLRIVWGGFQYMTSEAVTQTKDARTIITMAVVGLILLLGSWLILFVINPDLTKLDVLKFEDLEEVEAPQRSTSGGSGGGTTEDPDGPVTSDSSDEVRRGVVDDALAFAEGEQKFTNGLGQESIGAEVESTDFSQYQTGAYEEACRAKGRSLTRVTRRTCESKSSGRQVTRSGSDNTIIGNIPVVGWALQGTGNLLGTACLPDENHVETKKFLQCTERSN